MIELVSFALVAIFFAVGLWPVAAIWLAVGIYSTINSPSRGILADIGFVFAAPVYCVLEG